MKSKIKLFTLVLLLAAFVALPAFADLVNCEQKTGPSKSCELGDFLAIIALVVNFLLSFSGLIAILFVLWGGLQMILANGNPSQIQAGKSTITYAVLGLILTLAAYMIIAYVIGLLTGNAGGNPFDSLMQYITK